MPDRHRGYAVALRRRVAYHRDVRRVRRSGGLRQTVEARRAADDLRARYRGDPGVGTHRDARQHDQALQHGTRCTQRPRRRFARAEKFHEFRARHRSAARICARSVAPLRPERDCRGAGRDLGTSAKRLQALSVRHRRSSGHRCMPATAPRARHRRGCDRPH